MHIAFNRVDIKKIMVTERSYRKFYDTELDNPMAYIKSHNGSCLYIIYHIAMILL